MGKTVAFVPARGNSVRIPRKNLACVGVHSLLARTIFCAARAGVDEIVVSTDDDEIGQAATHAGAAAVEQTRLIPLRVYRRPEHLASDTAQIEDAIAHWLHRASPTLADDDVIALLQPTSPMRRPETIRRCVDLVRFGGFDSALTITLGCQRSGRLRAHYDGKQGRDVAHRVIWDHPIEHRPRSQDAERRPAESGCVYAFSAGHFRRTKLRMGGREACVETSWLESYEIDSPQELLIAQLLAPHVERLMKEGA